MRSIRPRSAFSLVEVIIAVGLFAVAVTVVLGLLPALARQSSTVTDAQLALRLPDALRAEMQRLADLGGFDALAGELALLTDPVPATTRFVAAGDGARLHSLDFLPPPPGEALAVDSHYFLVEVWRFPNAPISYHPGGPVLPVHVRVSWPYRIPGTAAVVAPEVREQVTFNLVLNR